MNFPGTERAATVQKARIVTTSWDDGEVHDLKVAEFLRSRGLAGTFYVPITPYKGRPALNHADLRYLAGEGFEIGAHGYTHQNLPTLSPEELARDVNTCKRILEDVLGQAVRMFSYPKGRYNLEAVRCLREAGYQGARTTRMLVTTLNFSPFEMPTTVQVYPHSTYAYLRNLARARTVKGLYGYIGQFARHVSWVELGKSLFDSVLREGGIWHLYGHSWEIEKRGLWDDLGTMLDYVCRREGVIYKANEDVLKFRQANTQLWREKQRAS